MTKHAGFYTIVQFSPEPYRGEAANVGVVVAAPGLGIRAKFAERNEHVKRMFGADSFDEARLTSAKTALADRVAEVEPTEASMQAFIASRAGEVSMMPLRPIVVSSLESAAALLFADFVLDPPKRQYRRRKAIDLATHFRPLLDARIPIEVAPEVELPLIDEPFAADFGYTNGSRHLIKSVAFSDAPDEAFSAASDLGTKGLLLREIPRSSRGGRSRTQRLIVVANTEDQRAARVVQGVLEKHEVTYVGPGDVDALVDRVRREAN